MGENELLELLARSALRLAGECLKLDADEERRFAEEGMEFV